MNIQNIFYLSYWFEQPRIVSGWVLWFWVGCFLLLVLSGLILKLIRHTSTEGGIKEVLRRFGNIGLTMGFIGLFWLSLRQAGVPFLSFRFWLWFWAFGLMWWLYRVAWYMVKRIPAIRSERLQRELRARYLPKRER